MVNLQPKETIWAVVAARMGSQRMAGKSMANLAGRPSLAHIISRLRRSRYLHGVVVATPTEPADDVIRTCARQENVPVYSGSVDDVLARTLQAAEWVGANLIVQVTGDCPLIDVDVCDRIIEAYLTHRPDYASNVTPATYPNGMDTEVFATTLLRTVESRTDDPADREHVTLYIREHPELYKLVNVEAPPDHHWPSLRLTLDTPEDYRLITAIYEALYATDQTFGLTDVLSWLRLNPHLLEINKDVVQKAVR